VWLKSIASQNSFVIDVDTRSRTTSVVGSSLRPTCAPTKPTIVAASKAVSFNPAVLVHQLSDKNVIAKTRERTSSPFPLAASTSTIAKPTASVQASKHPLAMLLQVPQYAVIERKVDTAPRINRESVFSIHKHRQPMCVLVAAV
jgi:hypothetical protein